MSKKLRRFRNQVKALVRYDIDLSYDHYDEDDLVASEKATCYYSGRELSYHFQSCGYTQGCFPGNEFIRYYGSYRELLEDYHGYNREVMK